MRMNPSKSIVLMISVALMLGFGVLSYLSWIEASHERELLAEGWSVDGPQRYTVGAYHLILIPFVLAVGFAKRYWTAALLCSVYLALHLWSLYLRLQDCFLGEDICPPSAISTRIMNRFNWFDWLTTLLIPIIGLLLIRLVAGRKKDVVL